MPLTMVGVGESRPIIRIGGSDKVRTHLENLGFVEGEMVRVVSDISGNLIVQVKDARVAISRELATKILVKCMLSRNQEYKEEDKTMTLKEAKIGSTVTVTKVGGEGALKRRIMDMGITKGVQIYVRKVAPLGDPVEVTVRGYELSLRKADADLIEVK